MRLLGKKREVFSFYESKTINSNLENVANLGKRLNCSACSSFCMQICFFCNVLPFCIRQNIFVRMVDIFHSITNEWAKFDTKDMFSFIF